MVLVGKEPIDWKNIEALKDAFSESDLPIMVDVLDWYATPESFRSIILGNYELLQKA